MKATLNFRDIQTANSFTIMWGRKTLTGHDMTSIKSDGSVDVTVYDVSEEKKIFIVDFIANAA